MFQLFVVLYGQAIDFKKFNLTLRNHALKSNEQEEKFTSEYLLSQ